MKEGEKISLKQLSLAPKVLCPPVLLENFSVRYSGKIPPPKKTIAFFFCTVSLFLCLVM